MSAIGLQKSNHQRLVVAITILILISLAASAVGVTPVEARKIEIPSQTEPLEGGKYTGSHFFKFPVQFGDVLTIFVPQKGDNVRMILYDPDGLEIRRGTNARGADTKFLDYKFTWGNIWYLDVRAPDSTEYDLRITWAREGDEGSIEEPEENKNPTTQVINENMKVFELESEVTDLPFMPPTIKSEIKNVNWEKLGLDINGFLRPDSLLLKYNLEITLKSALYEEWSTTVQDCGSWLLEDPARYEFKTGTLHYREPLYDMLIRSQDNPYSLLAYSHFNPTSSETVPEEMKVEIKVIPLELRNMVGIPPEEHTVDMSSSPATTAIFIFGSLIDLTSDTKLKVGEADSAYWHDYADVGLCLLKLVTGVEGVLDISDAVIQFYAGEYVDAIIGLVAPAPIELLFAIPEARRMGKEFLAPTSIIEDVWGGLRKLGYSPLSKCKTTKDFPIWINLEAEKLAMVDPTGIVHQVDWPKNFHVSLPYFSLSETNPARSILRHSQLNAEGKLLDWKDLHIYPADVDYPYKIVPPPAPYCPWSLWVEKRDDPPSLRGAKEVFFTTDSGGELILYEESILDFGWEDKSDARILKKPYVGLVKGKLRIKNEDSKIGVYGWGRGGPNPPVAWCNPKGTEYTIEIVSEESFLVTTIEGSVEVTSANSDLLRTVNTGETQEFAFQDIPLEDEMPVGSSEGLTFESRSKPTGSEVQIPLTWNEVEDTVGNMDLTLSYDPSILQVDEVIQGSLTTDSLFDYNIQERTIKISLADSEGIHGDGSVAYIKCQVIGAQGSTSPLEIVYTSANKADDYAILDLSTNDGIFRVIGLEESTADCDGDGQISVVDALCALQMAVGKRAEDLGMDVNGDSKVTSLDARNILEIAIQGEYS